MEQSEHHRLITQGLAALDQDNTLVALMHFERADRLGRTPVVASCLGYCLAKEQRQLQKAAALCLEALRAEPGNALHYHNLGRVHLLAGQRLKAITVFQKGMKQQGGQRIVAEMKKIGLRKPPLFKRLPREHPLNKYGGKIFHKLGLR